MSRNENETELQKNQQKVQEILQKYAARNTLASKASAITSSIIRNPVSFFQLCKAYNKSPQQRILALAPELAGNTKEKQAAVEKIMGLISCSQVIQVLLGSDIDIPNTVIHLSVLYWLTDEVLDNKRYTLHSKTAFADAMHLLITSKGVTLRSVEPQNENEELNQQLRLIQLHIQEFFKGPFTNNDHEEHVMRLVIELNLAQNKCTLVQSMEFYQGTQTEKQAALPDESVILAHAKHKGAISFELYALLLTPKVTPDQLGFMHKLGELYQLADDIDDIIEDLQSKIITPAIMSLMTIKPTHISLDQVNALFPPHAVCETLPQPTRILQAFRTNFSFMLDKNARSSPGIRCLDMTSFYEHCYHVLDQIQKTFTELKKNRTGIHWTLLNGLERKMVENVQFGIDKVVWDLNFQANPTATTESHSNSPKPGH